MAAQGIHGLQAHAVQAHALLESLAVIFSSGVEHTDGFHQLPKGNAAPIVAHGNAQMVLHRHFNALAGIHLEFVNAIVNNLFQQHVDAVFGMAAVSKPADVHAGARAHMLHVRKVTDVLLVIFRSSLRREYYFVFFHKYRFKGFNKQL